MMDRDAPPTDEGWWVISGERVRQLLERAAAGESPDLIIAEEYANSTAENTGALVGDCDDCPCACHFDIE